MGIDRVLKLRNSRVNGTSLSLFRSRLVLPSRSFSVFVYRELNLPEERWQFIASVPTMKDDAGRWHGLNFTSQGF